MSLFFLEWHLLFFNILFHHYPICLINNTDATMVSALSIAVSTSFIDFYLPRSSKWRGEYTSTFLDQGEDLGRTQYRLSTNLSVLLLHPTLASIGALNLQFLGLVHFSSMNYLWLGGFTPIDVGFWVLCSVKSISLCNSLFIFFTVYVCFHFLWCVFDSVGYSFFFFF